MVDVASLILGHDILAEEKLSHGMELVTFATVFAPLVAASALRLGDDVLRAGSQFSRYGDDVADVARLGRHGDEIGSVGRYGDNLDDATNLQRRLDDWVSPDGEMARLAKEERRRLAQQQLDDASLSKNSDDLAFSCRTNSFIAGALVETEDGPVPIEWNGDDKLGFYQPKQSSTCRYPAR